MERAARKRRAVAHAGIPEFPEASCVAWSVCPALRFGAGWWLHGHMPECLRGVNHSGGQTRATRHQLAESAVPSMQGGTQAGRIAMHAVRRVRAALPLCCRVWRGCQGGSEADGHQ
eukprot:9076657-Alexandrium_andersonii.AAC.1